MPDEKNNGHISSRRKNSDYIWLGWLTLPVVFIIGLLWWESTRCPGVAQYNTFLAVAHWFDPVFFQYNLIMVSLAILILPLLVFSYIRTMINRKQRRLLREIDDLMVAKDKLRVKEGSIKNSIERRASFKAYVGSLSLAMIVVALGASILLLFKPTSSLDGVGVHFNVGANMLMMGPFSELFEKDLGAYYAHLIHSLTAFQFGFLGAYIYFIGSLARAYFTLDLTPHTFVDGSIRMIVASVLALVLSFAYGTHVATDLVTLDPANTTAPTTGTTPIGNATSAGALPASATTSISQTHAQDKPTHTDAQRTVQKDAEPVGNLGFLPVISFFFGFYPKQALSFLGRFATSYLGRLAKWLGSDLSHRELPLSSLAGVSYAHVLRLEREGFDNIENLSHADALDLAIRTGFGYKQLAQWIDDSWLAVHLREDYSEFVKRTGITGREELGLFFSKCKDEHKNPVEQLKMAGVSTNPKPDQPGVPWEGKLIALEVLLASTKS